MNHFMRAALMVVCLYGSSSPGLTQITGIGEAQVPRPTDARKRGIPLLLWERPGNSDPGAFCDPRIDLICSDRPKQYKPEEELPMLMPSIPCDPRTGRPCGPSVYERRLKEFTTQCVTEERLEAVLTRLLGRAAENEFVRMSRLSREGAQRFSPMSQAYACAGGQADESECANLRAQMHLASIVAGGDSASGRRKENESREQAVKRHKEESDKRIKQIQAQPLGPRWAKDKAVTEEKAMQELCKSYGGEYCY